MSRALRARPCARQSHWGGFSAPPPLALLELCCSRVKPEILFFFTVARASRAPREGHALPHLSRAVCLMVCDGKHTRAPDHNPVCLFVITPTTPHVPQCVCVQESRCWLSTERVC